MIFFILRAISSDTRIAIQALLSSICKEYLFPPSHFQSGWISGLKRVSCRQHIYASYFSASLCLLVEVFNPFTFKVIIDICVPIGVLIALDLFL